jgi:hypothetical protein
MEILDGKTRESVLAKDNMLEITENVSPKTTKEQLVWGQMRKMSV